jgi:predicted hydrocarbon binding protein
MDFAASLPASKKALPDTSFPPLGDLLMASFEEVLGGAQWNFILQRAGVATSGRESKHLPFDTPAQLAQAVEDIYGEQTGRGLCLRVGRVMMHHGLRAFSGTLGLSERSFRLLPPAQKIRRGLDLLAWLLNHSGDQRVRVENEDGALLLINEKCPHCRGLRKAAPCCQLPIGALQEGLAWLCGGKRFSVEEISCQAMGDPSCTYRIPRKPLA